MINKIDEFTEVLINRLELCPKYKTDSIMLEKNGIHILSSEDDFYNVEDVIKIILEESGNYKNKE